MGWPVCVYSPCLFPVPALCPSPAPRRVSGRSKRGHCRPASCPHSSCAASPGRRRGGCWWGAGRWEWEGKEAGRRTMKVTLGAKLEASWAWRETGTGCCRSGDPGLIPPCGWSGLTQMGCQQWMEEVYYRGEGGNAGPHLHRLPAEPGSERWEAPWSQLWPRTCLQQHRRRGERSGPELRGAGAGRDREEVAGGWIEVSDGSRLAKRN